MENELASPPNPAEKNSGIRGTVSRILLYFFAVFCATFAAGYLTGAQDRMSPDNLKRIIIRNMHINTSNGAREYYFPAKSPYWVYKEGGAQGFFDQQAYGAAASHNPILRLPSNPSTISTSLLTAAAMPAMTLTKKTLENPSFDNLTTTLAVVAGGVSGWTLGYMLGESRDIKLTQEEIRKTLEDQNFIQSLSQIRPIRFVIPPHGKDQPPTNTSSPNH